MRSRNWVVVRHVDQRRDAAGSRRRRRASQAFGRLAAGVDVGVHDPRQDQASAGVKAVRPIQEAGAGDRDDAAVPNPHLAVDQPAVRQRKRSGNHEVEALGLHWCADTT